MKNFAVGLLFAGLSLFGARASLAQDANYWTNQYGNEARLLGGAVVGSSKDVAAAYYNPGRLALISDPELLLAGNVIRLTSISLENALGEGTDVTSRKLGGAPALFAGELHFDKDGKNRFAYSFLTRSDFAIDFQERADLTELSPVPLDFLSGSLSLRESMSEYWAGFTWSRAVSKKVGVGATFFGLVRNQSSQGMTLSQAKNDSLGAIAVQRNDYNYEYAGMLMKLGIGADLGDWRVGLSLTTPNLKVHGSGQYGYDDSVVGQDVDNNGTEASQILTGYQQDLTTDYHSPTSVAVGAGYTWKKTHLDATVEWFDAVPEYTVLFTEPATSVDGSVTIQNNLVDDRKSVTNFGVGVEQIFSDKVQGYLSYRSDKSSSVPTQERSINISNWDISHVAGGAKFAIGNSSFTVGAVFSAGSSERPRGTVVYPDRGPGDSPLALPQEVTVKYTQLTLILGFNIAL